jgi:site-specific recombinase XerD
METTLITTDQLQQAQRVFSTLDISEGTREDYRKSVKPFIEFVQTHPLSTNTFLEFKQFLKNRHDIGVSAKNKYLVAARILLKEMNRTGAMPIDITQNIKGFSQSQKHKKDGLSDQEISTLGEKLRSVPVTPDVLRLRAIIAMLTFQGLRQKEVVGIDVQDIDFLRGIVMITGKGRDDSEPINLHPDAAHALSQWINIASIASGPVFFGRSNRANGQRLSTRGLRRLVTEQLIDLGITKSTHGFRHFFTTKLIRSFKGNLLQVAQLTRHKSMAMLQVYNDDILTKESLPQYYAAFDGVRM